MKQFSSSDKQWSEITNIVDSICGRYGIAFGTNTSEYCVWVRPDEKDEVVYKEITGSLKEYEKLVEIKKPLEDSWEKTTIEILRK